MSRNQTSELRSDTIKQLQEDFSKRHKQGLNFPFTAKVLVNYLDPKREKNSKKVREITFQLPRYGTPHIFPGDTLKFFYKASPKLVNSLLTTLKDSSAETLVRTKESKGPADMVKFSTVLGIKDALEHNVDVRAISVELLKLLQEKLKSAEKLDAPQSHYSQKLNEILADKSLLKQCLKEYHLIDVLSLFPNLLTAQEVVDVQPQVSQRTYTPSHYDPAKRLVTVAVSPVDYKKKESFLFDEPKIEEHDWQRYGSCSQLLSSSNVGDEFRMYVRSNVMSMNFQSFIDDIKSNHSQAILLIGPGTGISPFISFLEQMPKEQKEKVNSWLITGGKYREDLVFKKEVNNLLKDNMLDKMDYAASRENPQQKQYVTDVIIQKAPEVWDFLHNKKAHICVYGDGDMGKDVKNALKKVAMQEGKMDAAQADAWLEEAEKNLIFTESTSVKWKR